MMILKEVIRQMIHLKASKYEIFNITEESLGQPGFSIDWLA